MEIGIFQLENLVSQRLQFVAIDLLDSSTKSEESLVNSVLEKAHRFSLKDFQAEFSALNLSQQQHYLLFVNKSDVGERFVEWLAGQGYSQVYYLVLG